VAESYDSDDTNLAICLIPQGDLLYLEHSGMGGAI